MARTLSLILLAGLLAPSNPGQEPAPANSPLATLPLLMRRNKAFITGSINDQRLTFLLDTGCGVTTLHPNLVEELKLRAGRKLRMIGIAGDEWADTYRGVTLRFGECEHTPRYVASLPSERQESRRRRDGVLGHGFFKDYVVEIDPGSRCVRLYSPTNFSYSGKGEIIPLFFRSETPVVEGYIVLKDRAPIKREFEVDSGCDSGLCLGADFVKEVKLLESIATTSSEKFGIGGSVETKDGRIPMFRLGNLDIEQPQADFFASGSPVDEPAVGHIGMGIFQRHKIIFDYARKRMILEPVEPK